MQIITIVIISIIIFITIVLFILSVIVINMCIKNKKTSIKDKTSINVDDIKKYIHEIINKIKSEVNKVDIMEIECDDDTIRQSVYYYLIKLGKKEIKEFEYIHGDYYDVKMKLNDIQTMLKNKNINKETKDIKEKVFNNVLETFCKNIISATEAHGDILKLQTIRFSKIVDDINIINVENTDIENTDDNIETISFTNILPIDAYLMDNGKSSTDNITQIIADVNREMRYVIIDVENVEKLNVNNIKFIIRSYVIFFTWLLYGYNNSYTIRRIVDSYSQVQSYLIFPVSIIMTLCIDNDDITYKGAFYMYIGLVLLFDKSYCHTFEFINEIAIFSDIYSHHNIDVSTVYTNDLNKASYEALEYAIKIFEPYDEHDKGYLSLSNIDKEEALKNGIVGNILRTCRSTVPLENNIANMFYKIYNIEELNKNIIRYIYSLIFNKKTILAYTNVRYKCILSSYMYEEELNDNVILNCIDNIDYLINLPLGIQIFTIIYNKQTSNKYKYFTTNYNKLLTNQNHIDNLLSNEQKNNEYNKISLGEMLSVKKDIPISYSDICIKNDIKNNFYANTMSELHNIPINKKCKAYGAYKSIITDKLNEFLNNGKNKFGTHYYDLVKHMFNIFYEFAYCNEPSIKDIIDNYNDKIDDYLYYIVYYVYIANINQIVSPFNNTPNIKYIYYVFLGIIFTINHLQLYKKSSIIITENSYNMDSLYELLPKTKYITYDKENFIKEICKNINVCNDFINGYFTDYLSKIMFTYADPIYSINIYTIYLYVIMNDVKNINKYNVKMPIYYFIVFYKNGHGLSLENIFKTYTINANDYFNISIEDSIDILNSIKDLKNII